MDILPPKRPLNRTAASPPQSPQPVVPAPHTPPLAPRESKRWPFANKRRWILIQGILAIVILIVVAALLWYFAALQPMKPGSKEEVRIKVSSGETVSTIANNLEKAGIVRSSTAFRIYAEISGTKSKLQAGGYVVSPGQSTPDIITHLVGGNTDELSITIPPGVSTIGLREELKKYGYSDQEITAALDASYDSPLLADKPANVSLDGYIFPETFNVDANEPLQSVFERSFDELYARLQKDGMIEKFKARGLNIHQALTLASIIQKEESDPTDQKQVAQVFYLRLERDMPLESDPTFIYAANQLGVEPSISIDSPYNTRKYAGLPPGPIANMNYSAIEAVAAPAPGDYLYFVAGDDGMTYFSHTLEQHIENIKKHCHDLCN